MTWDSILFLAVCCWIIGSGASFVLACLQFPLIRLLVGSRHANRFNSGFWFGWALFPLCGALALTMVAAASAWLSAQGWIADHCLEHPGHIHLCLRHITDYPLGWAFWGVAGILALLNLGSAASFLHSIWSCQSRLRFLPVSREDLDVVWIESKLPLAFVGGLIRPRCYLSEGMRDLLSQTQLEIVQSHEQEHLRRHDPRRLALLRWMETWLPGLALIGEKWRQASEIECDQACLEAGFSRAQVASTILLMQRRSGVTAGVLGLAYGPPSTEALRNRIESLVVGDRRRGAWPVWLLIATSWLWIGAIFTEIHHALETVLGWLM